MSNQQNERPAPSNEVLEEKINSLEKRIPSLKWSAQIALSVMGFLVVALVVYAGLTLYGEKNRLQQTEKDLEARLIQDVNSQREKLKDLERNVTDRLETALGKIEGTPKLVVLSDPNHPLDGSTIGARISETSMAGRLSMEFNVFFKNTGNHSCPKTVLEID